MSSLIRDVLEYSRLSIIKESFVEVDLNQILDNVKTDFELLIADRNAVIENDKLPIVRGNERQLHQLFANLINNSIKFNEKAPHIQVRVVPLSDAEVGEIVSLDKNKKYSKLLFKDNGIGFEPHFNERVFTIFQRLNTRTKYEGTGIGLALCKKIVENHEGHISTESALGKGTTFSVILPLAF